ncbi:hypothetical protein B0O95_10748 [Mycetohabitans endofungorum]|uniref:Peptidase S24-like protein n=1 Tax=Mycetohabitans endofungorum TaxID=417203 RepID=A0A2P5KA16_9BURK|nr:hypothetical protein B0O95_10748 [Mycetohabitans endofungorum]
MHLSALYQRLRGYYGYGDSLYPVCTTFSLILRLRRRRTALRYSSGRQVLVKRLQRLHGPYRRVISANADYPPYEVPIENANDQRGFAVIGRVVWFGRQV